MSLFVCAVFKFPNFYFFCFFRALLVWIDHILQTLDFFAISTKMWAQFVSFLLLEGVPALSAKFGH